jgi:2-dehydropantoate 2-reductase
MRHAVLGVGGVGGFVGAALARGGCAVTAVVRAESLAAYPAELALQSPLGTFSVPIAKTATVAEPFDVLWIAVKATQLDAALDAIVDASGIGAIVPLLNGTVHVAQLRARFGEARVVPATIAIEAERVGPGRIVHRSPFAIVSVTQEGEARLRPALALLRTFGVNVRVVDDEATLLWSKLAFLAPLALTTTAARATIGEVAADAQWRARLEACVAEACAVAAVAGAALDAAFVARALVGLPAALRSSMQKDVAAGQRPELDAIAGPILDGGARAGIDVPVTRELVRRIEEHVSA